MPRRHPHAVVLAQKLQPAPGQTWLSLIPQDADEYTRLLFQLFHDGIVEPWESEAGTVHLILAHDSRELEALPSTPWPAGFMVSGGPRHPTHPSAVTKGQPVD